MEKQLWREISRSFFNVARKDTLRRMSAIEEIGTFSPSHSTGGIFLFEADRSTFRSIWC